jgi:TonB-linked SusC/RagA family outer membrane protein
VFAAVALLAGLVPAGLAAQQPSTITGRVTSDAAAPLGGVAVAIPELRLGAYTDQAGRYTIAVPATAVGRTVLVTARRLGNQPDSARVTLAAGEVTRDFTLKASVTQLTGIVVTALGAEVEKTRLGTSQQQLTNAEINETRAQNVLQQIQGKVSGVQITGAGTQGGSVNMIIRGQNSISGDNQPLFIVDGIPVSNNNRGGDIIDGYDFGNAISDLNPDDIETMSILKGPNAAAIYGSRAANGAVVITTKQGRATGGRMRTEVATSYSFERPSVLPDFQNLYGQGARGEFDYVNGAGLGRFDNADQSWGPRLDGRTTGCRFIPSSDPRFDSANPFTYDQTRPCRQFNAPTGGAWLPHPNNVSDFFQTGHTFSTTAAVSGGTDRASARLSLGNDNIEGVVPNNTFNKTTALLNGSLQVSPNLTTNATLQYVRNSGRNRAGTGYVNSTLEQFFWFGRQVDINALKNFAQGSAVNNGPAGREYNWNYNFHNNPWWISAENPIGDNRDRFIGSASASYRFTPWLNATLRSGSDIYRLGVEQQWGQGNLANADPAYSGAFSFVNDYVNANNTELFFNADHQLNNSIQLTGMVGGNIRREQFRSDSTRTAGLSVPGIYNVRNAAITPTLGQYAERRGTNSVFAQAAATFNGWWTVEGTARNDWSSTLPSENNSYFYPSINTSVVLTDALPAIKNSVLSYLKLRGSVAQVGNDAQPFQLQTTYTGNANKFQGLPQFTLGNNLANARLKPELTRAGEVGAEVSVFDGRATLDATWYDKSTRNQIFNVTVSPTSGFTTKAINAGEVRNRGFEALLTVTPLQLRNGFEWTSSFNFSRNRGIVEELAPGVETIVLGQGIFAEYNIEARKKMPYGTIFGSAFERDTVTGSPTRGMVFTHNGIPVIASDFKVLGSIEPNWLGGWSNTFSMRGLTLGVNLDIRNGGKIVSSTNEVGEYSGVLASSLKGREIDWNKPGIVFNGVDDVTGQPNTTNVRSEVYFQSIFPVIEPYVYDGGYVKLREVRLGYDVPSNFAGRYLRAQSVNVALTGRNLWLHSNVPNIDPEFTYSSTNLQGAEYAIPSNPRSIGVSVRVTP